MVDKAKKETEQRPSEKITIKSPLRAIRGQCLDCCGGSSEMVKTCTDPRCPLYPFRLGKNPYRTPKQPMSEEKRQKLKERFVQYRERVTNTQVTIDL